MQRYGSSLPPHVVSRLEAIAAELKKDGIAIVKSPDGTTTVITRGKARRDLVISGDSYADPALDLAGLETALEQLMQQYDPAPPREPSLDHITSLCSFGTRHILFVLFLSPSMDRLT